MKVAINAWFWDNPTVGSGQYLKYLLPALLQADPDLNITLVSPKPFNTQSHSDRLHFYYTPISLLPSVPLSSDLSKVWFEQITFPRACRRLGVDVAHVPYFGSSLSPAATPASCRSRESKGLDVLRFFGLPTLLRSLLVRDQMMSTGRFQSQEVRPLS